MIVYDVVLKFEQFAKLKIKSFDGDHDIILFDDNKDCVVTERFDLLSYRVDSINVEKIEPVPYHADTDSMREFCEYCIELDVSKPTLMTKLSSLLMYYMPQRDSLLSTIDGLIHYIRDDLKICFIRLLFNKWFVPNSYLEFDELQCCAESIFQNINYNFVYIYNKNIWKRSSKKYKYPVFRIWVAHFDEVPAKEKYLGFINWDHDFFDGTMVFTLEPEPKWLQDYDKIKRQLRSNIISKDEIQKVVDYVSNNYELFRSAWDVNTEMFGTYQYGFDLTKLKSID